MAGSVLLLVVAAYAIQMVLLRIGLSRADRGRPGTRAWTPRVSVIVAARNEEEHIGTCLTSLLALDYPAELLELIVVDDGSTDRTAEIIRSFAGRHPGFRPHSSAQRGGTLRGKTNAVAQGIELSSGEILLFTDADCRVPTGWVRGTLSQFREETGVVGGFTLLRPGGAFAGIQALDWVFLFSLASATAGWNLPLTAIGNNVAVRRKAYDAVGGYAAIPFSVTEDYALVRAIYEGSPYRVRFPLNPETVVVSSACRTAAQLFRQKQRWGVGGLDMVARGIAVMSVGWLARLAIVLALPDLRLSLTALAMIGLVDALFLWKPLSKFRQAARLVHFPLFELYFTFYVLLLPFVATLSKHVVWKERRL